MADTKTHREVAQALIKAFGEKVAELKKPVEKMALPESSEKAIGGKFDEESTTDHEESSSEASAEAEPVLKTELCKKCGQMHMAKAGGCMAKMDLPTSPEKAIGGKVAKSEYTSREVAEELRKAVVAKIDVVKAGLVKLAKAEGTLPTSTPSNMELANAGTQPHAHPAQRTVFELMQKTVTMELDTRLPWAKGSKKPKAGDHDAADEGSGGQVEKGKLAKEAMSMGKPPPVASLKPKGVPGAKVSQAPKAPKPPQAPGAAPSMHKMDIPSTPEQAKGGAEVKKTDSGVPTIQPSPVMDKMELPGTPEKAIGGKMAKAAMSMHPSPVFKVRLGGKDPASQQATQDASRAAAPAVAPAPAPKLPSVEEHAQRADQFAAFTPKGKF